jgi:hypothetical protein
MEANPINAGLADPMMKARFADLGAEVLAGSPADLGKLIAEETEKWGWRPVSMRFGARSLWIAPPLSAQQRCRHGPWRRATLGEWCSPVVHRSRAAPTGLKWPVGSNRENVHEKASCPSRSRRRPRCAGFRPAPIVAGMTKRPRSPLGDPMTLGNMRANSVAATAETSPQGL